MSASTPVDQAVRDAVVHETDRSVALSAGAGSGKTRVLSERLVELLVRGMDPERVAAITFTEKAAGELQRRVRDALERRFAETPTSALAAALDRLDALTLTTIHAFCRELLAAEPLSSRWAPGTTIGSGDDAFGAALRAFRHGLAATDPVRARLVDELLSPTRQRTALATLLARRDLVPAVGPVSLDLEAALGELAAYVGDLEGHAALEPQQPLAVKNQAYLAKLRALVAEGPAGVEAALLTSRKDLGGSISGSGAGWKDAMKALVQGFDEWRARQLTRLHRDVVLGLREHAVPAVLAARRADATATFDDLLFRAAALLADGDVRARLAQRFDALLIDEVQDTDPIQAEVATRLASARGDAADWRRCTLASGRLFAVGDAKQSIYRFRGADVSVWSDLREVVRRADPEGVASLRQNFRSVPGIVGWVGATFASMPGFEAQVAYRSEATLDPVVVLDAPAVAEGGGVDEADRVLRHLADLRAAGATVATREGVRPLRFGDVMLLVPRWANAQSIAERFLAAGVEAVVEGGGGFFRSDEVKLALSALRAMEEPGDGEAVVHVMRGLFGFPAAELLEHVSAGGSWRLDVPQENGHQGVRQALETLRRLRRSTHPTGSWVPRLDALLAATRATAVWSLLVDGPSRLANLDKLRAILREVEAEERSPAAVLTRLRALAREDGEGDLSRLDPEGDAVRVTTVFSAKGLEAPVVVLLDLDRRADSVSHVADREAGRLHLPVGDLHPPDWETTKADEKAAFEEERQRLMYVAATRPRDQLVIVRPEKDTSLLEHLAPGLPPRDAEHDSLYAIAPDVQVRVRHGHALPPVSYADEAFPGREPRVAELLATPGGQGDPAGEAAARKRHAAVRASKRTCARWRSVGEVVRQRRLRGTVDDAGVSQGVGREGGVLVHAILEELDLRATREAQLEAVPALADALGAERGLSAEHVAACATVASRILQDPVLDAVREAPEIWQETPFAIEERGRVITGTIDLCFPRDEARERWVVVDWKSDLPAAGTTLRRQYEAQLELYAKALLATVAPCASVETVLVGPHPELAPEPAEEALANVLPEHRRLLQELLDAGAPVPRVGAEVGEPIVAELELAWDEAKVGLGVDLEDAERDAVTQLGWRVVAANDENARQAVASALGLALPDEESPDEARDPEAGEGGP
ncbi:MAG: UvrD-helicase domain-containing protein [Myxococcota bacterium]